MSFTTIVIVAFALLFGTSSADDPCRYETSKGVIDLTSVGNSDGTAAFPDATPSIGSNYSMCDPQGAVFDLRCRFSSEYSYNPCNSFSEGTACVDVAACQGSYECAALARLLRYFDV